jgi:hypothetical protein
MEEQPYGKGFGCNDSLRLILLCNAEDSVNLIAVSGGGMLK